jgi:hypothetical protein
VHEGKEPTSNSTIGEKYDGEMDGMERSVKSKVHCDPLILANYI